VSLTVDISERQLRLGLLKMALGLVGLFALLAVLISLVAGQGQNIAVTMLLICVSFSFLAHGFLALTKVIDWFEARKMKNRG
jgi:hypothetical protein